MPTHKAVDFTALTDFYFSSGPIPTPQIVISAVTVFSYITLRTDRLRGPPFSFGRTAMRRWDRLAQLI
jgi:hypothetical protein